MVSKIVVSSFSSIISLIVSSALIAGLLFVLKSSSSLKAYYIPVKNYVYNWINYVFKWLRLVKNPMQFLGVKTDKKDCDPKYDDDGISCWTKPGYLQKMRDPALLKPCSEKGPGLNDVAGSCWATQTDRGAGKIPDLKCPDGKVQRGALCFDPPPAGNEWTADYTWGKICPDGTRGDIATCWYDRGIGRIPKKRGCNEYDNRFRDDGTSCWDDSYGNGVGTIPVLNDCPAGSKDVAGTCWLDSSCKTTGGNCWGGGCRTHCPNWKVWECKTECDPIQCAPIVTTGCPYVTKNIGDRGSSCRDGKVNVAGLCYNPCKPGYEFVGGNICQPKGGPGIKKTLFDRQYCDGDKPKLVDGLCYPETKPGFGCTATTCSMSRNPNTPVGKPMWQYCKDSDRHIEGTDGNKLCYKDCPPRQHGIATMCIPEGNDDVSGAKCIGSCIKYARENRKYCPPNQHLDGVKLMCYDDCKPGWTSDGVLGCVKNENSTKTMIPEIKTTAFDRSYCKDSENFKLGPLNLLCYPILPTIPSYNKDDKNEVELKMS
jgi:hypothetical protein